MQELRGTVTAESEYEKLRLPSGNEDVEPAAPPAHAVLGVDRDADAETVRDAWRERVKEAHPDNGGTQEQLRRVHDAKEAMLDG